MTLSKCGSTIDPQADLCSSVENNLITFMSKPFMGVSASGCHTNISLWKGGKDNSTNCITNRFLALIRCLPTVDGRT